MNTVSTGNSIAAAIEPNDTNLVNAININANTKQINPICQFVINSTPRDVATPFPPLNLKNTGKVWPNTTNIPANWTNKLESVSFTIFPAIKATKTANTPFKQSHKSVKAAAFLPTVLSTLVVPAFPLPFSLTSNPANFLLNITEKLILPNKYAIIETIIYVAINNHNPFL